MFECERAHAQRKGRKGEGEILEVSKRRKDRWRRRQRIKIPGVNSAEVSPSFLLKMRDTLLLLWFWLWFWLWWCCAVVVRSSPRVGRRLIGIASSVSFSLSLYSFYLFQCIQLKIK